MRIRDLWTKVRYAHGVYVVTARTRKHEVLFETATPSCAASFQDGYAAGMQRGTDSKCA